MAEPRHLRFHLGLALLAALTFAGCSREEPPLVLATTTSMGTSGLLDILLPQYEAARVQPVLVGSGRALDMLATGRADVVISHAPARETAALQARPSMWYRKILYNDFLIVGPREDPAGVKGLTEAAAAMRAIAASPARFLSRGDESGTHERERALWTQAGVAQDGPHVVVAGAGMGQTLRVAGSTGAYTLTDRATFETLRDSVDLQLLLEGDPSLLNTYAVIADPANTRGIACARWLAEGEGRRLLDETLRSGTVKGFTSWPAGAPADTPGAQPQAAPVR